MILEVSEHELKLDYCHGSRTRLSLDKDAPEHRPVESAEEGNVVALTRVGGPHHHNTRRAA